MNGIPPYLFPFFFIAMWVLVCCFISFIGGWYSLSRSHRYTDSDTGSEQSAWYFCSLRMNFFSNYNNCINITLYENGIKLVPVFLFRVLHPPIFLRWSEMHVTRKVYLGLFGVTRIEIGDYSIRCYRSSGRAIEAGYRRYTEQKNNSSSFERALNQHLS